MAIHCPLKIVALDEGRFEEIDYRVMGHAYASQNKLGRLCEEWVYEADLKERLRAEGFKSVHTQVPVALTHGDFSKTYRLDLLADDALYELKTEQCIAPEHEMQLFNYLFLVGVQRGKLLNFRPPKVEGKLVATSLSQESRRRFTAVTGRWEELTSQCVCLRKMVQSLFDDWGAFLAASVYQEAIVHLLGGLSRVEHPVRLRREDIDLGTQKMFLHAPDVSFRITSFTEGQRHIEEHLRRLVALTDLKAVQWINCNHSKIEFTTLTNPTLPRK